MKHQHFFKLQPSEMAIFQAAAQIFSGYVAGGQVKDHDEKEFLEKATANSIALARHIENIVQSDDETGK